MPAPIVIKISGHELDDAAYLTTFAAAVAALGAPAIIVHGGGKEISALQTQMGITPQYIDGIRVTDAESLRLVEMVLCGTVNKRLVRTLIHAGVDALGMCGADRGLVRAQPMMIGGADLGCTGVVEQVRADVLLDLLDQNVTPVLAPICLGREHNFNVNADHVAGAVAAALDAQRLVFLSNVPGVLHDGNVQPRLSAEAAEEMIASGVIFGGMIPKVRTALEALRGGVREAVITDLDGLRAQTGTVFAG
jgi:acetylglutamate kinase